MSDLLPACAGFLLAVLWFDLMFDVQVRRHSGPELPESVVASISAYYLRVTTTSRPMGFAVGAVMFTGLVALALQLASGRASYVVACASVALFAGPVALALARTVPNAVRLGSGRGSLAERTALARSIYRDHVVCFGSMMTFLVLQLAQLR